MKDALHVLEKDRFHQESVLIRKEKEKIPGGIFVFLALTILEQIKTEMF